MITPQFNPMQNFRKVLASFAALCLFINQVAPASYASQELEDEIGILPYIEVGQEPSQTQFSGIIGPIHGDDETSEEFLENEGSMERSDFVQRGVDVQSFEDGVAELSEDYASAVIVELPTKEELAKLSDLPFEVLGLVIGTHLVLATSGESSQIRLSRAAVELINKAEEQDMLAAMFHTHPKGTSLLPTLGDTSRASDMTEFMFNEFGEVYAYNNDGIINEDPYELDFLIDELDLHVASDFSTVETRQLLNNFIVAVDYYNENPNDSEIFRTAFSTFPGHPSVGGFGCCESGPNPAVGNAFTVDFDQLQLDYDLRSGGAAGAFIDFGASTPQDLSGIGTFMFDMMTNQHLPGSTDHVRVEFVSPNNKKAIKTIRGIPDTAFGQFSITPNTAVSGFDTIETGFSFASVKQIVFIVEGHFVTAFPTGRLNIKAGGLDHNPQHTPVSDPDNFPITTLPTNNLGQRVDPTAFENNATVSRTLASPTFMTIDYNSSNAAGFGGTFVSYVTDPSNGIQENETINLDTLYPNGINIQLDNKDPATSLATSITQAELEITDINGVVDRVILNNINAVGQKWNIPVSDFNKIDTTKAAIITLLVKGAHTNAKLNVDWGLFEKDPVVLPTDEPNSLTITPVPNLVSGPQVTATGFSANDGSTLAFAQDSETGVQMTYNGAGEDSFGGFFLNYNVDSTPAVDTINVETLFPDPNGIVIQLDNGGTGLTKAYLEFQDSTGAVATVELDGVVNFGKEWSINSTTLNALEAATGIDMEKITVMSVLAKGQATGHKLNVVWGNFLKDPELLAVTQPDNFNITPVNKPDGSRVTPVAFEHTDGTNVTLTQDSSSFMTIEYDGPSASSFGGVFMKFDDEGTSGNIETVDFLASYPDPNGFVMQLDDDNSALESVILEFTDNTDKKARIKLDVIQNFGKEWSLNEATMLNLERVFGIDMNKIAVMSYLFEGAATDHKLKVALGNFTFTPSAVETNDAVTNFSAQRPSLGFLEPCAVAGQNPCTSGTLNTVTAENQTDHSAFDFAFNLGNGNNTSGRFAGAFMSFGANTISAASGIVLGLRGTGGINGSAILAFENADGKKVEVNVNNLTSATKKFKVTSDILNSAGVAGFDPTQISTIVIKQQPSNTGSDTAVGTMAVTTAGVAFIPDAATSTKNPTDLGRVAVGTLESCVTENQNPCTSGTQDTVPGDVAVTGNNAFNFNYNLGNSTYDNGRFGGALIVKDFNLSNNANPFVIDLNSANTDVVFLDFTDNAGVTTTVRVSGLLAAGTKKVEVTNTILASSGTGISTANIKSVALVVNPAAAGSNTATGNVQVVTNNIEFIPEAPTTTLALTDLMQSEIGTLESCRTENQNPCTSGTQDTVPDDVDVDSSSTFNFDYNLGNSTYDNGRFGGALIAKDLNLSNDAAPFVIDLNSSTTDVVFLDVTDSSNVTATVKVSGLLANGTKKIAITNTLLASTGTGISSANIKSVSIVVNPQAAGSSTATGNVQVVTNNIKHVPTAPVSTRALTDLMQTPIGTLESCATENQNPCTAGTQDTVPGDVVVDSASTFNFNYNLGNSTYDNGRFGGALIAKNLDLSNNNSPFVIDLNSADTDVVFLDFTDSSGVTSTIKVDGLLAAGTKKIEVDNDLLVSTGTGINRANIASVAIVVNPAATGSNTATGNVQIQTNNIKHIPDAATSTKALTNLMQTAIGTLESCVTENQNPCTSGTQNTVPDDVDVDSASTFNFDYNLGNSTYDNGRFGGALIAKDLNLSNDATPFVIDLNSATTDVVFLDFTDNAGVTATVRVPGLLANGTRKIEVTNTILASTGTGISTANIKSVAIVVNPDATGSNTATGNVQVVTDNIKHVPDAPTTTLALTDLMQTPIGTLESCVTENQNPCTTGTQNTVPDDVDVTSSSAFNFDYNLGNSTYDNGRFGGALIAKDLDLSNNSSPFVIDLNSTTTDVVFLDFTDNAGVTSTIRVAGLLANGTKKIAVNNDLLVSTGTGINRANIKSVAIVVNPDATGSNTATGNVQVVTNNIKFIPPADTSTRALTNLMQTEVGTLESCVTENQNPCTSGTQNTVPDDVDVTSSSAFNFDYNLGNSTYDNGRFGGALIAKDLNLSDNNSPFVIDLNSATTDTVFLDFTDNAGVTATVRVDGLLANGTRKIEVNNTILASTGTGVSTANIKSVSIVVNPQATGANNSVGNVQVVTNNIKFIPELDVTTKALTDLMQTPIGTLESCVTENQNPCTSGTQNTVPDDVDVTSSGTFNFDYNLGNSTYDNGRFGGALIAKNLNLSNDATPFVIDLNSATTDVVFLDVTDSSGVTATVKVSGLLAAGTKKVEITNTKLGLTGTGINAANIASIAIVVNPAATGSNTATGNVQVVTNNNRFIPPADASTKALTNLMQTAIGTLESCVTENQNPCTSGTQNTVPDDVDVTSSSAFNFDYNLGNSTYDNGRFGGALIAKDLNLSNDATPFVIDLNSATTDTVFLDFTDNAGVTATVRVDGLLANGTKKIEVTNTILASTGTGVSTANIKSVAIVVNPDATGSSTATGNVQVVTDNIQFIPEAPVTTLALTDLMQTPVGTLESCVTENQSPCTSGTQDTVPDDVDVTSSSAFNFDYNLANSTYDNGRFGGALIAKNLNLSNDASPFVIDLNSATTDVVFLDFTDSSNVSSRIRVSGLLANGTKKIAVNNTLLASTGTGISTANIASVAIVVNPQATGANNSTGNVQVVTNNIQHIPDAPVSTKALTDLMRASVGTLESCVTENQNPCTSGTQDTVPGDVDVDSNDTFNFNYNLGNSSYDNGRFGGALISKSLDLSNDANPFVIDLNSSTTDVVFLDFTDNTGTSATVRVAGLLAAGTKKIEVTNTVLASTGTGIDAANIASVSLVVNPAATGSNTATGAVQVITNNVDFTPTAPVTTDALTDFTALSPSIGELEPCSIPGQNPCTAGTLDTITALDQDSDSHFVMSFNLGNGQDLGFRRFGGTLFNFGSNTYDSTNDIVMEFKGSGTTGGKFKMDFVDENGNSVPVNVEGLTTTGFTRVKISKALLESSGITPFDATKIASFTIVVDDNTTGSTTAVGGIEVNTKGLAFQGINEGTPSVPGNHTVLPNTPTLLASGGNTIANRIPGFITQTQTSADSYNFVYDIRHSSTAFAFSQIVLDDPMQTLPSNQLVLGINGPNGLNIKIEVEDADGDKVTEILGLKGEARNYTIDLTANAAFDRTKAKFITLVMDRENSNGINRETITIGTKGLDFTPELNGDNFSAAAHTVMPAPVALGSGGGNTIANRIPGFITQTQTSDKDFNFVYDIQSSATAFVFSQIQLDSAGTTLPDNVTLGLNGPAGVQVKVEVEDVNGIKALYTLNMQGEAKNYTLDLTSSHIPAAFDKTKVKFITFVIDRDSANGNNRDTIFVNTAGLDFLPTVAGIDFNAVNHTELPGNPTVSATGGNTIANRIPGFITLTQQSTQKFQFVYDVRHSATAFAFAQINLSNSPLNITQFLELGVTGPSGAEIKVEVIDVNGKKGSYALVLEGVAKNFKLDLTASHLEAGFDRTQVQFINFVVDRDLANGFNRDTIVVDTKGLDFTSAVNAATYDDSAITTLPGTPSLTTAGGNSISGRLPGAISLTQDSDSEFHYVYDLQSSQTALSFLEISDTNVMSLPENLVLALRGAEGSQTKVEIHDENGNVAKYIANLRPALQNYTFNMGAANVPLAFDRTKVAKIVLVQDRANLLENDRNIVRVRAKGLDFTAPAALPAALQAVKDEVITKGVDYFKQGAGLDPATHLPYDAVNSDGTIDPSAKFTQPTLIGFYLQMLADGVNDHVDFSMTDDQLLTEINFVMDQLLSLQTNHGWNGLLPFTITLQPTVSVGNMVGLGDNLNLIKSLATMVGGLERATLTTAQQATLATIEGKVNTFIDNQLPGYRAFVHPTFGVFRQSVNTTTGDFSSFIDRTIQEFRSGLAFLLTRYPNDAGLPSTLWDNLVTPTRDYTTASGATITNFATFFGTGFAQFWPLLSTAETDFVEFRDALYNHFVTQADFAKDNLVPGFISASRLPEGDYSGDQGIREVAENSMPVFIMDTGSTYSLASAYQLAPVETLEWLLSIKTQIPELMGTFGLKDSARSNSEVTEAFLGIDIATSVLGMASQGADDFNTYLRNRNLELTHNLLYDAKASALNITKTSVAIPSAPTFPDRTFSVLRNTTSVAAINSFPADPDGEEKDDVEFKYGALTGGFGGKVFVMDETFDATASQLNIKYSVVDSPKQLKIEFKNASGTIVYETTINTPDTTAGLSVESLNIQLPNEAAMAAIKEVGVIVDQNATGDNSGEFVIHSMTFQHLAASQNIAPNAALGSGDLTATGGPTVQLISASGGSTVDHSVATLVKLNFNLTTDAFAGVSLNYDPTNAGTTFDLNAIGNIVLGANSDKATTIKIEVDDDAGKRGVVYLTDVNSSRQYYDFLSSLVATGIDTTKVKRINFIVDTSSVSSGNEVGFFDLEINGLQFP